MSKVRHIFLQNIGYQFDRSNKDFACLETWGEETNVLFSSQENGIGIYSVF
jgi:hypothetical protein